MTHPFSEIPTAQHLAYLWGVVNGKTELVDAVLDPESENESLTMEKLAAERETEELWRQVKLEAQVPKRMHEDEYFEDLKQRLGVLLARMNGAALPPMVYREIKIFFNAVNQLMPSNIQGHLEKLAYNLKEAFPNFCEDIRGKLLNIRSKFRDKRAEAEQKLLPIARGLGGGFLDIVHRGPSVRAEFDRAIIGVNNGSDQIIILAPFIRPPRDGESDRYRHQAVIEYFVSVAHAVDTAPEGKLLVHVFEKSLSGKVEKKSSRCGTVTYDSDAEQFHFEYRD